MVEKDDYDRAWWQLAEAKRLAGRRQRVRAVILNPSTLSGLILIGMGMLLVAFGVEVLGVYDACFADPTCLPMVSGMNFGEFFGILAVGIVLSLLGVVRLVANFSRGLPHGSSNSPI